MLTFVDEAKPDYVIVHKVDRLARNRVDDVSITMSLKEAGTRLISCNENIDDTPSGMLLHGIMSVLADYYSLNLTSEVIKGSLQKAKAAGLPGKAPVGYLNVRRTVEGRDHRTVEQDPIRGPLMASAFEQYAAGTIGLRTLRTDLTDRGLTTVGGPKTPSKPLSVSQLARLLKHPFYKGIVRYKSVEYPGAHEPLVTTETWQRVQDVFEARQRAAEKRRKHNHYLKGTLFCKLCRSRLIVSKTTNRHGANYEYFMCIARRQKRTPCKLQALPVIEAEQRVVDIYSTQQPAMSSLSRLEATIRTEINTVQQELNEDAVRARTTMRTLEDQQTKLLEAHLADAVPLDVLKRHQARLAAQLEAARRTVADSEQSAVNSDESLTAALGFASRIDKAYGQATQGVRRGFNQAIYKAIYLDDEGSWSAEYT